jgi:hypothetical protein
MLEPVRDFFYSLVVKICRVGESGTACALKVI